MKIKELFSTPKKPEDTTSSGTTSSANQSGQTQDIVPQDQAPQIDLAQEVDSHPDHSAIAEGVSQIFRRKKGGAPTKGFRCTSGPRKGRIVAKPSTCFMKTDPQRSAKIRKKRSIKAKIAGKKLGITKRSRAGSLRLKGAQIKKTKGSRPLMKSRTKKSGTAKPLMKSKTVKPK